MFLWVLFTLALASVGLIGSHVLLLSFLISGFAIATTLRWRKLRQEDQQAITELKTAREFLKQDSLVAAAKSASDAVTHAKTSRTRNAALTALAWAAVGKGYAERAKAALDRIEPHALDLYCFAAVESASGKPELAIQALELARSARSLSCDGAKLLVNLHARQNRIDRAVIAALQSREVLGADNCRMVVNAALEAGALGPAATLASALLNDARS
jgi:hypothetical protein